MSGHHLGSIVGSGTAAVAWHLERPHPRRSVLRHYPVVVVCLLGTLCAVQPMRGCAQAQEPGASDGASYRSTIENAVTELTEGRHAEALALFREAHRMAPSARTLRGIAMASFELTDYVATVRYAELALQSDSRPLPDELREQTEALSRRASAFVARYELRVTTPETTAPLGTTVRLDGVRVELEPVLFVGLGRHVLRVEAAGHVPVEETVVVRGGEQASLTLTLVPLDTEEEARVVTEVRPHGSVPLTSEPLTAPALDVDDYTSAHLLVGVAASMAATAIGVWGWYATRLSAVSGCDGRCTNAARLDELHDASLVLSVALTSTALALGIVGAVVWALTATETEPRASGCVPAGGGVRCRVEWL